MRRPRREPADERLVACLEHVADLLEYRLPRQRLSVLEIVLAPRVRRVAIVFGLSVAGSAFVRALELLVRARYGW